MINVTNWKPSTILRNGITQDDPSGFVSIPVRAETWMLVGKVLKKNRCSYLSVGILFLKYSEIFGIASIRSFRALSLGNLSRLTLIPSDFGYSSPV